MKILNKQEYKEAIDNGVGVLHFMGEVFSKNGQEIVLIKDKIYLFEEYEIGKKEWENCMILMEKERKEYNYKYSNFLDYFQK